MSLNVLVWDNVLTHLTNFSCTVVETEWVGISFFNCHMAIRQPTLAHSRGDCLTKLMVITAFFLQF